MGSKVSGRLVTIAVVTGLAVWALAANWPLNLGLDLRGGTSLRYALQLSEEDNAQEVQETTVQVVRTRLNSLGLREIPVYSVGDDGIVVDLPGVGPEESKNIQRTIVSLGKLEFLIVASDPDGIDLAAEKEKLKSFLEANAERASETWDRVKNTYQREFTNSEGQVNLPDEWQILERSDLAVPELMTKEPQPDGRVFEFFWLPDRSKITQLNHADRYTLVFRETNPAASNPEDVTRHVFTGRDLATAGRGQDRDRGRSVTFELVTLRQTAFEEYTGRYAKRAMAIVLDDQIQSAPVLEGALPGGGQITGPPPIGFGTEEQKQLVTVLQSGSLEVEMELESDASMGPSLGEDSIDAGILAISLGLGLVFIFMVVYYRGAGVIADIALALNLLLLISALALLDATITLPGLAGIVLTVGMAVDANILIFERVREEREKGKTLNQAFKNGYEKALSTILDANITTLITALVLQQVGTGPVKGFAITLSIGIVTSVFTALYVTRALFEFFAQKGILKELTSYRLLSNANFPFLAHARKAMAITLSIVGIGIVLTVMRGSDSLGLDFVGGYEFKLQFEEAKDIDEVRAQVAERYDNPQVVSVGDENRLFSVKLRLDDEIRDTDQFIQQVSDYVHEEFAGQLAPELVENLEMDDAAEASQPVSFRLNFLPQARQDEQLPPLDTAEVEDMMLSALGSIESVTKVEDPNYQSFLVRGQARSVEGTGLDPHEDLLSRVAAAARNYSVASAIPESTYIGPTAARELEERAIFAILISLVLIVIYIRFRFHDISYGFAAVASLVHDILFSLGVIVAMSWAGIVHVEIDLPMIAAFLTIIGYSLNDTIVVFDRVRENIPKYPKAKLEEVINTSVNQTLSRTILTSTTTFLVVAILFALNKGKKNVLEGFSFAMCIGVVIGTYSTIFIAGPVVVMLTKYNERKNNKARGGAGSKKKSVATATSGS